MPTPIQIVTTFLSQWGVSKEALIASIRQYFTDETVFENVGLVTTVGIEEAIGLIESVSGLSGYATAEIEILHIAADGDVVLTERIDKNCAADGSEIGSHRLMGVHEVRGDKIVAWRDYFDTATSDPKMADAARAAGTPSSATGH